MNTRDHSTVHLKDINSSKGTALIVHHCYTAAFWIKLYFGEKKPTCIEHVEANTYQRNH
jgi:hypothetical protein